VAIHLCAEVATIVRGYVKVDNMNAQVIIN